MGGSYLGLIVEIMVAILLVITIGYCLVVNRKLENLRSDKSELKEIILNLHRATTQAEQAIGALKQTAGAVEGNLMEHISHAQTLEAKLAAGMGKGDALLSKLAVLTSEKARAPGHDGQAHATARTTNMAPPAPQRIRHSEMGLGLLNAEKRVSGLKQPEMKDVA